MSYLNAPHNNAALTYKQACFVLDDHQVKHEWLMHEGKRTHMMFEEATRNGVDVSKWTPALRVYGELMNWLGH
jgi:hypothetical protein